MDLGDVAPGSTARTPAVTLAIVLLLGLVTTTLRLHRRPR
jgi:hypothetical protein